MFVVFDREKQKFPIKVWLEDISQIEEECLQQAVNLSNLPFLHKWVALMPDTHSGYGMPIGGVIATKDAIIPNAVGVDIGCGMVFAQTNIPASLLREVHTPSGTLAQAIVGGILRVVPTGFSHHKNVQPCAALDRFKQERHDRNICSVPELEAEIEAGYYQAGTLGGGNHFIELQEDEDGMLGIMIHSGSRNFGYKICKYFNHIAKELNKKWVSQVPPQFDLAFLPLDTKEGQAYLRWMNLALEFARENRELMLIRVVELVCSMVQKYAGFAGDILEGQINCHHNYAALENHYGENVWVHRKGAICAREGMMGIIPGAMGACSYIVRGKGNPESFYSCSHGAGRRMSRKAAKDSIPVEKTINDLKALGIVLGKQKKNDVSEECRFAYKDTDFVIQNEQDLVEPVKKLKTVAVVKG